MQQPFFRVPFAAEGDVSSIPVDLQPDGSISMRSGYGFDYERDQTTDPLAKDISRQPFNWLMNAVTQQLLQTQTLAFPEFITTADNGGTAYPYAAKAVVRYRSAVDQPWSVYISKEDNNTTTPLASGNKWEQSALFKSTSAQAVAGTDSETIITPATLLAALDYAFATRLPSRYLAGDLVITFGSTPSPGTLVANGAAIGRAAYPALFNRIGTMYGAGNGSTTFNLPNVNNGYTLVAANGTAIGTQWAGSILSHNHAASSDTQGWHGHDAGTYVAGNHNHGIQRAANDNPAGEFFNADNNNDFGTGYTNYAGDHSHGVWVGGSGNHAHNIFIGASGGSANLAAGMFVLHTIAY